MTAKRAVLLLLCATLLSGACGSAPLPAQPTVPAIATIQVGTETFRVQLVTETQLAAARVAMAGALARIPHGTIVAGTEVNTGYSWHLENVAFVEMAAEVCDGTPSMVERQGTAFGDGRFCPWSAQVVSILTPSARQSMGMGWACLDPARSVSPRR